MIFFVALLAFGCGRIVIASRDVLHPVDRSPRPTPQMMAPSESATPQINQGGRVSYALIEPSYVGTGWTNN